jgi:hypothetical protein
MGGTMQYIQCDNAVFVHHLYHALAQNPKGVPGNVDLPQ